MATAPTTIKIPKVVKGHRNTFNFKIADTDLSTMQFLARFDTLSDKVVTDPLELTNEAGVDTSNAAAGEFAVSIEAAATADWIIGTKLMLYLSIFNADDSLFAKVDTQLLVSA